MKVIRWDALPAADAMIRPEWSPDKAAGELTMSMSEDRAGWQIAEM